MAQRGGQKDVGSSSRKPRVQIEYEVDTRNSKKLVQLPFVVGVMADLSGSSKSPKAAADNRKFDLFDQENFEDKMAGIAPRAVMIVDNKLQEGDDKLRVDLTFSRMDHFSPAEIARRVPELKRLLDARQQLNDLGLYLDGTDGAQNVLNGLIKDPELMKVWSEAKAKRADETAKTGPAGDTAKE